MPVPAVTGSPAPNPISEFPSPSICVHLRLNPSLSLLPMIPDARCEVCGEKALQQVTSVKFWCRACGHLQS